MTSAQAMILAAALLGFLTALLGFLTALRGNRKLTEQKTQIGEVHLLVNSQLASAIARVAQLVSALEHAGVAVPARDGEDPPGPRAPAPGPPM